MSKSKFVDPVALELFAKGQWNTDASLREEFGGDYKIFFAYTKAVASGNVKILSGPAVKNG